MADPFLGEVRIVGFDFAPRGWAFCNGQEMPIAQNTALYSLLQSYYGGDDKVRFNLPNIQGRVVVGTGESGGVQYDIGSTGGAERVTIGINELRAHTHFLGCHVASADTNLPGGNAVARAGSSATPYIAPGPQLVSMDKEAISKKGGDQDHNNLQPFIALRYCIAIQGIFPPRG